MTRGNPGDLQPFDPEIDRTFHRLARHSVHLDYPEHFVPFEHPEHSVIGESEHSVVGNLEHSGFEHSDFEHTENMAQPPPRERTLREMAAPDFTYEACAFNTLTRMSHMFLKLD